MRTLDAGRGFVELLDLMARLRGEGGCPWDREQTRESLRPFLVEETHEVLEALDDGDPGRVMEELGDLLFQIVFHAQIAGERGEFTMATLLAALLAKMVRRHPHVFGDSRVESAAEALAQWERIKQAEGGRARGSALDGIPRSLPALSRAQRTQARASRVGFDWPHPTAALEKVEEETRELRQALGSGEASRVGAEVGDLLFSVVNVARLAGTDPEAALQGAIDRFRERFKHMEAAASREASREDGGLSALTPSELERLWLLAKSQERS